MLRLEINPIKIGKEDVRKVLETSHEIIYFINKKNGVYFPITGYFNAQFSKIMEIIQKY